MSWEHLVFSYGPPPTGAITLLSKAPTHIAVQYSSKATGSYFEVVADVITVARLGVPPLPAPAGALRLGRSAVPCRCP